MLETEAKLAYVADTWDPDVRPLVFPSFSCGQDGPFSAGTASRCFKYSFCFLPKDITAFVENCKLCYSLGQNGITDEMLPRFREANVGLDNLFHPSAVNVV